MARFGREKEKGAQRRLGISRRVSQMMMSDDEPNSLGGPTSPAGGSKPPIIKVPPGPYVVHFFLGLRGGLPFGHGPNKEGGLY